jgi:DNA polymerase-3 subunit delta
VFYVFHGDDEFSQAEELTRLRGKLAGGDPAMADLNTTFLDGKQLTFGELRHACDTIPFMADRRLVIVHNLLGQMAGSSNTRGRRSSGAGESSRTQAFLEDLVEYLPHLPPTTRLIFVENEALPGSHPVLKLAEAKEMQGKGFSKLFAKPKDWDLPNWILQRARGHGGDISHEAATTLAALVGADLRLLDQEIDKLYLYTDGQQITKQDVQTMVSRARETNIFDLVDCVGRRQTDRALKLLHSLLDDGEAPLYILAMLARQIRILIQVSELQAQGLAQQEIANRLKLHPFVVKKGLAQTENFRMDQLEAAHQRLVEADRSIKTGQTEDVLALDLLVTDLATR